jgi:flavodoxin
MGRKTMEAIVIYTSIAHGNTKKVAEAIAEALKADLVETEKANPQELPKYDLIGFGSGIYNGNLHKNIYDLITKLPVPFGKKAFIFSTSGYGKTSSHEKLKVELINQGFDVVGSFACKGLDNFGAMKLIGGVAKGRPNDEDLKEARGFAKTLTK